jgi:hypothetical protein
MTEDCPVDVHFASRQLCSSGLFALMRRCCVAILSQSPCHVTACKRIDLLPAYETGSTYCCQQHALRVFALSHDHALTLFAAR